MCSDPLYCIKIDICIIIIYICSIVDQAGGSFHTLHSQGQFQKEIKGSSFVGVDATPQSPSQVVIV